MNFFVMVMLNLTCVSEGAVYANPILVQVDLRLIYS